MIRDRGIIVIGVSLGVGRAFARLVSESNELKAKKLYIANDSSYPSANDIRIGSSAYGNYYNELFDYSIDDSIYINELDDSKLNCHQHTINAIPKPITHRVNVSTRNKLYDKRRVKQSARRRVESKSNKYIKVL